MKLAQLVARRSLSLISTALNSKNGSRLKTPVISISQALTILTEQMMAQVEKILKLEKPLTKKITIIIMKLVRKENLILIYDHSYLYKSKLFDRVFYVMLLLSIIV